MATLREDALVCVRFDVGARTSEAVTHPLRNACEGRASRGYRPGSRIAPQVCVSLRGA